IEYAEAGGWGRFGFVPALIGFIVGGLFLRLIDYITPHLHMGQNKMDAEGPKTKLPATTLLFLAVTIHNIPEGLSVGVAYGANEFNAASLARSEERRVGQGCRASWS